MTQPDADGYYRTPPGHLLRREGDQLVILTADHDVVKIPMETVNAAIHWRHLDKGSR